MTSRRIQVFHENAEQEERRNRRWTPQEDDRLIRQVKAFPQNLAQGFRIVAEELGRTPSGVQAHWYSVLSKRRDVLCFFTASEHHVSKNRKNGEGIATSFSIWQRLLRVIRNL